MVSFPSSNHHHHATVFGCKFPPALTLTNNFSLQTNFSKSKTSESSYGISYPATSVPLTAPSNAGSKKTAISPTSAGTNTTHYLHISNKHPTLKTRTGIHGHLIDTVHDHILTQLPHLSSTPSVTTREARSDPIFQSRSAARLRCAAGAMTSTSTMSLNLCLS